MVLASGCKSWLKTFFHNCLWCVFVLSPIIGEPPQHTSLEIIISNSYMPLVLIFCNKCLGTCCRYVHCCHL